MLLLRYDELLVFEVQVVLRSLLSRGLVAINRLIIRLVRIGRSGLIGAVGISPVSAKSFASHYVLELIELE